MTAGPPMQTLGSVGLKVSSDKVCGLRAFTARLTRIHGLSDGDGAALGQLPSHETVIAAGQDIVRVGDRADHCAIILEGFAFGYKLTGDGRRQILCFNIAGDMSDLQGLRLGRTDRGVSAASGCRVGYVPRAALSELCSQRPSLMMVLWRETLFQAAIVDEWLLNVGRRNALARLAHLVCEMVVRQRTAGMTSDHSCSFPLTQTSLADALGLSNVHLNRTIQRLRSSGLIEWKERRLTVLDWKKFCMVADFDPGYLHVELEAPTS